LASDTGSAGPARSWRENLGIYRHPRVLAMLFLGFSAGLPFLLVAGTLTAWLTTAEVSMGEIGMFAWIGILYSLKFLWAPLVDRMPLPFLTRSLGRRRSWMLISQIGVAAALAAVAFSDPTVDLTRIVWFALLAAFASATQDIAIDAYRIEAVEPKVQGAMAASYQFGYRLGIVLAGAGALFLANFVSWRAAYLVMAVSMTVGMITVLIITEPAGRGTGVPGSATGTGSLVQRLSDWLVEAFTGPVVEFFQRNGRWALVLLIFIGFYRVTDMVLGVMANPFYIELGFSLLEIGAVTKIFGIVVTLSGAVIGGVAVARYGLNGPLVFGAVLLAVTNLFFAGMALYGPEIWFLVLTISADNLAAGFTGTVFIAYLSGLTNVNYTATQYALFSSLMTLPGKVISGFSGFIVEAVDWFSFFVYASVMGIPGILLAIIVTRHHRQAP
jgi:PAT family beta-lactamase induction signal transducer AmpG